MLNKKNKPTETSSSSKPIANNDSYTRIGEGVKIEGDINCKGDVRVDGDVQGNITSTTRIIIGTKGRVLGNIYCDSAEIDGKMKGKMEIKNLLSVTNNADIEGDVVTGRLSIVDPSNFNVNSCKMQKNNTQPTPTPSKS